MEKIQVVLQSKSPGKPQAILLMAIEKDWKPGTGRKREDVEAEVAKRRKETDELEKRLAFEREELKKATAEAILAFYETIPKNMFVLEKRMEITSKQFMGNPNLKKALEKIRKEG